MQQSKRKTHISEEQNKQNSLIHSTSSLKTLNFKSNRNLGGLIEKDSNSSDDRVKMLMNHKEQLQKMLETEAAKHKQEIASMFRRNLTLDGRIANLEKVKIENQEEIQYLNGKITQLNQKISNQEKIIAYKDEELQKLEAKMKKIEIKSHNNEEKQLKVSKLQKQLSEKTLIIQKLSSNEQSIRSTIEKLQQQNTQLSKQLKSIRQLWNTDIKNFQMEINKYQTNKNQITSQYQKYMQKSEGNVKNLKEEIAKKDGQIKQLQEKCENLEINIKNISTNKKQDAQQEIKILKFELERKTTSIKELQQNLTNWQQQAKKIAENRDEIEAQLLNFKSQMTKIREDQKDIDKLKRNYEEMIETYKKQVSQLSRNIKVQREKNEQLIQQLQANREQYQEALRIQASRCLQFEQLVKCLKQKLDCELEEFNERQKCAYMKLNQEKVRNQEREKLMNAKLRQQKEKNEQIYKDNLILKHQIQGLKENVSNKEKQLQRKLIISEQERVFLEQQVKKWKEYRNQFGKQYEELKKQNKKNKFVLEEKQGLISKLKVKIQSLTQLQTKCDQYQREKMALIQKHQEQIIEMIKKYDIKIQQLSEESKLFEQKVKNKIKDELQFQHNAQLAKIRRETQDDTLSIARYQQKIEDFEKFLQETQKSSTNEIEKWRKLAEQYEKQLKKMKLNKQQNQRDLKTLKNQIEDLQQKITIKDTEKEQILVKVKKLQATNTKIGYQLDQTKLKLKQTEKLKAQLQQKYTNSDIKYFKIQSQKAQLQIQLKMLRQTQTKKKQTQGSLNQSYQVIYTKYMKYKQAYLDCRDKLKRQTQQVFNDQRYTQEILNHCKTLIPKIVQ